MPSMSYCAFENTAAELRQCQNMIAEAVDDGEPLDLNRYEQPYFDSMKRRCQELIAALEQYEEHFGDDELSDDRGRSGLGERARFEDEEDD